jgi:uncharacterized cupredoxin-like copper-binding protein
MARALTIATSSIALTLLAACGGDDDIATPDEGGGAAGDVTVVAEDVDFGADAYQVEAGDVTFDYVNEGVIEHSLVVEGVDDFRLLVETRGDTDQGSVELEPGSYRLICDIPGHAQAGMVADLEVS